MKWKSTFKVRTYWPWWGRTWYKNWRLYYVSSRPVLSCALMAIQPDLQAQKGLLQEAIEKRGHIAIFYPKFHCELNFVEYYWGSAKRYTRDNCGYNIAALRVIVPQTFELVSSELIWKFGTKQNASCKAIEMVLFVVQQSLKRSIKAINEYQNAK